MPAKVANSDVVSREEGLENNRDNLQKNAQNAVPNAQDNFEARSHSNLAGRDTDDRVDEIIYGNPICSLK